MGEEEQVVVVEIWVVVVGEVAADRTGIETAMIIGPMEGMAEDMETKGIKVVMPIGITR